MRFSHQRICNRQAHIITLLLLKFLFQANRAHVFVGVGEELVELVRLVQLALARLCQVLETLLVLLNFMHLLLRVTCHSRVLPTQRPTQSLQLLQLDIENVYMYT